MIRDHWSELFETLDKIFVSNEWTTSTELRDAMIVACSQQLKSRLATDPLFILEAERGILERTLQFSIMQKEEPHIVAKLFDERNCLEFNDVLHQWENWVGYIRYLRSLGENGTARNLLLNLQIAIDELRSACTQCLQQLQIELGKCG